MGLAAGRKEQKPLSTEETELNSIAFLEQLGYTCVPPGKEQKQEIISVSEMVSKYRNTDEYDDCGNYKGKPVNCMIRAYEQGIRDTLLKVKEQKPAEMDNEEIELSDFESELFSAFSDGWQQYLHGEEVDVAQWAKEHSAQLLNVAKQELKPAEWSEEDKRNLLDVKTIIDQVWNNQDAREGIERSEEELKSLWHWLNNIWKKVQYPQPHWKPSEEQMWAVFDASERNDKLGSILLSLYNDLKKL